MGDYITRKRDEENMKILLAMGSVLSFMSLSYASAQYLQMRSMETLLNAQDNGNDVVVDKLGKIDSSKAHEAEIFLSEMRNRGKQLSLLHKGLIKVALRGKLFAEVEIVLWLISASVFSILLIHESRVREGRGA